MMKKKSKKERDRAKLARRCEHNYCFMEAWQDAKTKYWSFHCIFCLDIVVRSEPLSFIVGEKHDAPI
jgi:hypothetical protein